MPKSYPPEFRRRVLALVEAGRSVAQVAVEVGISGQAIYGWRRHTSGDQMVGVDHSFHETVGALEHRRTRLHTEPRGRVMRTV